jgi:hypothetical protein
MTDLPAFVTDEVPALSVDVVARQTVVTYTLVVHELVWAQFGDVAVFLTAKTEDIRVVFEVALIVLDVFRKIGDVNEKVFALLLFRVIPIAWGGFDMEIVAVLLK